MSHDLNDAIQSLARISQAAARLMTHMHWSDAAVDPNEELDHMRANLDRIEKLIKEASHDG